MSLSIPSNFLILGVRGQVRVHDICNELGKSFSDESFEFIGVFSVNSEDNERCLCIRSSRIRRNKKKRKEKPFDFSHDEFDCFHMTRYIGFAQSHQEESTLKRNQMRSEMSIREGKERRNS
jgi:hypothetical protein